MYVIIGVVIFLFILLFANIKINIEYHDTTKVKINYLFFHYNILPKKNNKSKNKTKKDKKKSSKNKKQDLINTFKDLDNLKAILNIFFNSIKSFILKAKVKLIKIDLSIAKDNACDTALTYGKICATFGPIINIILENDKFKKCSIKIYPNFKETKTIVNADLKIKIKLLNIFSLIVKAILDFIKYYIKIKVKKGVKV